MDNGRGWYGRPWRVALAAASGCLVVASVVAPGSPPPAAPRTQQATSAGGAAPQPVELPPHVPAALSRPTTVQGLGDSVPAAAACGCTSYVTQLAQQVSRATAKPVAVANGARNGLTSSDVLAQVTAGRLRATPDRVTVITIGANDFDQSALSGPACTGNAQQCYGAELLTLRQNIDAILAALLSGPGPHGPVLVTGYWNVFLDGDVGAAKGPDYVRDSDGLTRAVNAVLQASAQRHGLVYVDLYGPFKTSNAGNDTPLLAADGDHPSASGHVLITTLLWNALVSHTR